MSSPSEAPAGEAASTDIQARLLAAVEFGREAGRGTLKHFRQGVSVERKSDDTPVTIADREAELLLRERIGEKFPDDAILGEEFPEKAGTSGYQWILDPIDGTKSFICGVPLYGTMIGVTFRDAPQIGVVDLPGLDERYYAAVGGGAWMIRGEGPPESIHCSDAKQLNDGLFCSSQIDVFSERGAGAAFLTLQKQAWITRTWGDCFGYMLVASGRALAMVDPRMSIWDAAALAPILQEAGGSFTDWSGTARIDGGEGIGAAPGVLEEILTVTRAFAPKP